ncbi:MAG TPA: disulfide bond formation protein B [Chlamydiales bacterium]|jgi:disulfide bond formation protein DsbB|nr:disulfide bond formation protein B [Chlamydiales bacterium]
MRKYTLYLAWVVSLFGVLFSVYSSEILGMEVCKLCWYQRCALFPLALLLGIAVYRNDRNFTRYGLVLAGAGAVLAWAQVFIPASLCSHGCVEKGAVFWFLTMPMISGIGFLAIFCLLWCGRRLDEVP